MRCVKCIGSLTCLREVWLPMKNIRLIETRILFYRIQKHQNQTCDWKFYRLIEHPTYRCSTYPGTYVCWYVYTCLEHTPTPNQRAPMRWLMRRNARYGTEFQNMPVYSWKRYDSNWLSWQTRKGLTLSSGLGTTFCPVQNICGSKLWRGSRNSS